MKEEGIQELRIVTIQTFNPEHSFTTPGEALVRAVAEVVPADAHGDVEWLVEDDPSDQVATPVPEMIPVGRTTVFEIPPTDVTRWNTMPHPGLLNQKSLSLTITAVNGSVESAVDTIRQDEIDTARQEYLDLGLRNGVPGRA